MVELVRANHPEAVRSVREAGRVIGQVLAVLVAILNPDRIIQHFDELTPELVEALLKR